MDIFDERYNQIIHETYEKYLNYPLATIHDHRTNILYKNMSKGWCMLNARSMASPHLTRHLTKEEFINKIKTDDEFAKEWGLKIEERELSWEERVQWVMKNTDIEWENLYIVEEVNKESSPTKLITITYKDEKIEVYE